MKRKITKEQEQRVKALTECIKFLEEMKSTKGGVIVIADDFTCTSIMDMEWKTYEEIFQNRLNHILNLIINCLGEIAEKANMPLTNILLPVLIEVAKKEGIEVGAFSPEELPKEVLETLEKREEILN